MERLKNIASCFKSQNISQSKEYELLKRKPWLQSALQTCLHSYETRSPQQINATNDRMTQITLKNIERLSKQKELQVPYQENILFICLPGIPAFPKQFDFLNLPGQKVVIAPVGFQPGISQEQITKCIPLCFFDTILEKIHQVVQEKQQKEIIFVYHSFGTYYLSCYLHKYGHSRVKGLIQIGAAPIRHYEYITEVFAEVSRHTKYEIQNKKQYVIGEKLAQLIERVNKEKNIVWPMFKNLDLGVCFAMHFKSKQMRIMFDLNRRYPNVLKLMIFGSEDTLFQPQLVCQRADFYSKQQIKNYKQLKSKRGLKDEINLQDQFIFRLDKGKHSVHMQKKYKATIKKAVHEYLSLIL